MSAGQPGRLLEPPVLPLLNTKLVYSGDDLVLTETSKG